MPFKKSSHVPLTEEPAVRAVLQELGKESNNGPLSDQLRAAADRLKQEGLVEHAALETAMQRLTTLAASYGHDLARLLDAAALTSAAEFFDPRADRVSLMTLHAAKGLEFPVVFIVGLEDGILPLSWGEADDIALAEERRLFYVGMTRAKDRLILSRARQRFWRGRAHTFEPSPFLSDIENELVKHQRREPMPRKPQDRQLKLL